MKHVISLLLLIIFCMPLHAQNVQWASKVIEFSSETQVKFDNHQYRAEQILGKPNVLPAIQSSACAWRPSSASSPEEFIKVGFEKPMQVRQIVIAENYNAGSITQVYLHDENDKAYVVYRNGNLVKTNGGLFSLVIPKTTYKVTAVKIVLRPYRVAGRNEIDAIGISDSDAPVEVKINLGEGLDAKSAPEKLDINTNTAEIAPVVSPDGKLLYFTRDDHPNNIYNVEDKLYKQDVWVAKIKEDGTFETPKNVGTPINTDGHNACFSISTDGNTMLLNNKYLPEGLVKGISISKKVNGVWTQPVALNVEGFENLGEYAAYYLSQDGKVLLMSLHMGDSYGGNDLYVSFNKGGNNWSAPKNLGEIINSAETDTSPFLASDGTTLYYSSGGRSGYGNQDIYVTRRLDDTWTNWSEPQNVGTEINSNTWDAYFTIAASGEYAYYTRGSDIYRVKLSEVNKPDPVALIQGKVYNKKTGQLIVNARIIMEKLPEASKEFVEDVKNQEEGYKNILKLGASYRITAEAKGFFPVSESIDLTNQKEYKEISQDFYLVPLEKGTTVRLNYIYFPRGSSTLLPESFPELDKIVEMMQENPEVDIRLEGHTEIYGNKKSLVKLSDSRVASVKRYLVSKGIEDKRIKYKGFGPTKPLTTKDDEEARQLNRRVEVKIL